ncbi:MAG: hypothetical protein EOP06_22485 [Proteobacteria bacterium]|nr:MAG: hypothetical protein EOP06_22485 [Pseudomonadota bacterium]
MTQTKANERSAISALRAAGLVPFIRKKKYLITRSLKKSNEPRGIHLASRAHSRILDPGSESPRQMELWEEIPAAQPYTRK